MNAKQFCWHENKTLIYLSVLPVSLSLWVSAHQEFVSLPYGKKLKINLIVNSSLVQLYYRSDHGSHLLLDKGEFTNVKVFLSHISLTTS